MNDVEISRIAAAIHELRPDWPATSLRSLLHRPELIDKPRASVAVALTWIACDSETKTPGRVLEPGAWWKATQTSAGSQGLKVYGWTEGDPRTICVECSLHRDDCKARAKTNGHEFQARLGSAIWSPEEESA